jgi:hypothetical protein
MNSHCARSIARRLVRNHGDEALDVASGWIMHFVERGNDAGAAFWSEVLLIVHAMATHQPPRGTTLH